MIIELVKRKDGRAILRCVRVDGTTTWQTHDGRYAQFFPYHDLTHWAVETGLGYRNGFFGLIEQGWEIEETTGKSARGPLPSEAIVVEHLAGLLDRERQHGAVGESAAVFNEQVGRICETSGLELVAKLSDEQLRKVRARRDALHARWYELPTGETLTLAFP